MTMTPRPKSRRERDKPVWIEQDGTTLRGGEWVTPDAYLNEDIEQGRLPCLKGSTPCELPSLPAAEGW